MVMNVLYFIFGLLMIGLSSWGIQQQAANEDVRGEWRCAVARFAAARGDA